jgi:hypothetical protein
LAAFIRRRVEAVNLATLREKLAQLHVALNKAGSSNGDPLNLWSWDTALTRYLHSSGVAGGLTSRSTSTVLSTIHAFLFRSEYFNAPVSPCMFLALGTSRCKARDTVSLRNHLRLWLAPFTIDGQRVWVGQISRDIGIS